MSFTQSYQGVKADDNCFKKVVLVGFDDSVIAETIHCALSSSRFSVVEWISSNSKYCTLPVTMAALNDNLYALSNVPAPLTVHAYMTKYFMCYCDMSSRYNFTRPASAQYYADSFRVNIDNSWAILSASPIDFILFSNIPHEGIDAILYRIAEYIGLKCIFLYQTLFPSRFLAIESAKGRLTRLNANSTINTADLSLARQVNLFYMNSTSPRPIASQIRGIIKVLSSKVNACFIKSFSRLSGASENFNSSFLVDTFSYAVEQLLTRTIRLLLYYRKSYTFLCNTRKFTSKNKLPENFIYFPLHLQPELTTTALGGLFSDQILAIQQLQSMLPCDWKIVVKENPKQTSHFRESTFFHRLSRIPDVVYVNSYTSIELIQQSKFVATITGTAGWEAICLGKSCIYFGMPWYEEFEGTYKFHSMLNFKDLSMRKPQANKIKESLDSFLSVCYVGVIDAEYRKVSLPCDQENLSISESSLYNSLLSLLTNIQERM